MTQEQKQLLIQDLCPRLPYGVKGIVYAETSNGQYDISGDLIFFDTKFNVELDSINTSTEEIHVVAIGNEDTVEFIEMQQTDGAPYTIDEFTPYLRPLSSMTMDEVKEFEDVTNNLLFYGTVEETWDAVVDWLNEHHFDHRKTKEGKTLIEAGLALEAPKDMYNFK